MLIIRYYIVKVSIGKVSMSQYCA